MSNGVHTPSLMSRFNSWVDRFRADLNHQQPSTLPIGGLEAGLERAEVFKRDVERLGYVMPRAIALAMIGVARNVNGVFVEVTSGSGDSYRHYEGPLEGRIFFTRLQNVPDNLMVHLATAGIRVRVALDQVVTLISTGVGMLAWHGGEWAVNLVSGKSSTLLSTDLETRQIVYGAIGITLLARSFACAGQSNSAVCSTHSRCVDLWGGEQSVYCAGVP
ncbi:MAG: hypothetical protein S4CHLAM102_05740 [Chlamydiia bacterium]|nr:hypothetical protein [Chlamydiia bacterium]